MISVTNLSKRHGHRALFVKASMQLNDGEKVGLLGPNGAGESTLLEVITGEDPADVDDVMVPKRTTIGYFRQDDGLASFVQQRWSHLGYQLWMTSAQCAAGDESALRRGAVNHAPGHGILHASTEH